MLGTDTPQPTLDFQSTVFPALSILDGERRRSSPASRSQANPGDGGAFGDIVSGPRALAFSADGRFAFVVDTDSEDVLVDRRGAARRGDRSSVRCPGTCPRASSGSDGELYVQERNSEDIAAFHVDASADGGALDRRRRHRRSRASAADPMPADLRLGQQLFYSANSDEYPMTQNHWVSCATCHIEGRSDARHVEVRRGPARHALERGRHARTRAFSSAPPTARSVQDYWQTIDVEQGGHFTAYARRAVAEGRCSTRWPTT